jgi:hypothetical protein
MAAAALRGPQPPVPNQFGLGVYYLADKRKQRSVLQGKLRVVLGLVDFEPGTDSFRADGSAPPRAGSRR